SIDDTVTVLLYIQLRSVMDTRAGVAVASVGNDELKSSSTVAFGLLCTRYVGVMSLCSTASEHRSPSLNTSSIAWSSSSLCSTIAKWLSRPLGCITPYRASSDVTLP